MSTADLVGKAQTVLGTIEAEDLNIVLPHEHCLIDMSVWFQEPATASEKLIARQPLAPENLWYVRYHPFSCLDNVQLLDEQLAIEELKRFKLHGGSTVVDVTNIGIGRDPLALTRISRATNLNIIMGSGYYVEKAQPAGINMSMEMIAADIVRDITVGVGNSGIRAGLIGEIGIMGWPLLENEKTIMCDASLFDFVLLQVLEACIPGERSAGKIEVTSSANAKNWEMKLILRPEENEGDFCSDFLERVSGFGLTAVLMALEAVKGELFLLSGPDDYGFRLIVPWEAD